MHSKKRSLCSSECWKWSSFCRINLGWIRSPHRSLEMAGKTAIWIVKKWNDLNSIFYRTAIWWGFSLTLLGVQISCKLFNVGLGSAAVHIVERSLAGVRSRVFLKWCTRHIQPTDFTKRRYKTVSGTMKTLVKTREETALKETTKKQERWWSVFIENRLTLGLAVSTCTSEEMDVWYLT